MWRNECAWSCEEMRVCNITLNIYYNFQHYIYIYTHRRTGHKNAVYNITCTRIFLALFSINIHKYWNHIQAHYFASLNSALSFSYYHSHKPFQTKFEQYSKLRIIILSRSSFMEPSNSCWVFRVLFIILVAFFLSFSSLSWPMHPSHIDSMAMHRNHTAISDFRLLNQRKLPQCPFNVISPSPKLKVSRKSNLVDEEYLRVNVI